MQAFYGTLQNRTHKDKQSCRGLHRCVYAGHNEAFPPTAWQLGVFQGSCFKQCS